MILSKKKQILEAAMLILVKVLSSLSSAFILYWLTRNLSTSEFGLYSLYNSYALFFSVIAFQWLNNIVIKYISKNQDYVLNLFKRFFRLIIVPIILLSLLFSAVLGNWKYLLVTFLGISYALYSYKIQVLISLGFNFKYNKLVILKSILSVTLVSVVSFYYNSFDLTLLSLSFSNLLAFFFVSHQFDQNNEIELNDSELIKYGLLLAFSSICTMIIDFSDRYIVNAFHGPSEVALYASNYDLVQQLLGAVMSVLPLIFAPKVFKYHAHNNSEQGDKVFDLFRGSTILIGFFLVLNFLIFYPLLIQIIDNRFHVQGILVPFLISISVYLAIIKGYILDVELQLRGDAKVILNTLIFMALFNMFLNLILVPKWSFLGASISTFCTFLIGLVYTILKVEKFKQCSFLLELLVLLVLLVLVAVFIPHISEISLIYFLKLAVIFNSSVLLVFLVFNLFGLRLILSEFLNIRKRG